MFNQYIHLHNYLVLLTLLVIGTNLTAESGDFAWKITPNGININSGKLKRNIEFYGDNSVRVCTNLGESHSKWPSLSVIASVSPTTLTVKLETDNSVTLAAKSIIISIDKASAAITFSRLDGNVILAEKPTSPVEVKELVISDAPTYEVSQRFIPQPDEAIYGLGQCIRPFLNYRDQEILLVQTNVPAFTPVITSTNNYGILWDVYSQSIFKDNAEGMSFWAESAPAGADYYLMVGNNIDAVINEYRMLTGASPMLPKQAFGFFMSKERYETQQQLIDVVTNFRNAKYPIDYIVQDWQYWKAEPGKWTSMTWCPERFPDPKALTNTLHNDLHVKLMVSIWPTVGSDCDLARELDAKNLRFKPEHWITKNARVYDAYSQEGRDIYFKHMKKGLLDVGVDAMWMDGTEVETRSACHSPQDMIREIKENGINAMGDFTRYLNSYSLVTTKGSYEGQRATINKRVLTLTRSAWAGQQRYAALPWSGDTNASWDTYKEQIVGGLSASLSGLPYWTQDTGGFFVNYPNGNKNKEYQELLARWNQFAIFNPLYRWHGTSIDREPYLFKEFAPEMYESYLSAAQLRMRLLPYIYSMAWKITQDSYTMTRQMSMDFPNESRFKNEQRSFMFGPALLVDPVTRAMYHLSNPTPAPVGEDCLTTPDGQPGVKIEYYSGQNFEKYVSTAVDPKVDYTWPGPPLVEWPQGLTSGENFSCRIAGFVTAPEDGEYEIGVAGDDGFRLWLDGEMVVDDWNFAATRYQSVMRQFKKGQKIAFRIDYFQAGMARDLRFAWRTPAQFREHQQAMAKLDNLQKTYLPKDASWYNFWTNTYIKGGKEVEIEVPLTLFPLYVKAGSILPLGSIVQYATESIDKPIELRVYAGKDAVFQLYADDNETYNYEKGQYATIELSWNEQAQTLTIGDRNGSFPEMITKQDFAIVLVNEHGVQPVKSVIYSGKSLSIKL